MPKLIADTNVWYEIGDGTRDSASLKAGGQTLVATPTSILEIASPHRLEKRDTWPKRRKAAMAVLDHAAEIADDTENHLAGVWGMQPAARDTVWRDVCEILSGSQSPGNALQGIVDRTRNARLALDVSQIQTWRETHWDGFKEDVINAIDQHVPGYKLARSEHKYRSIPKDKRAQFASDLRSPEVRRVLLVSTFFRALPSTESPDVSPSSEQITKAGQLLAPYIDAYTEYIYGCAVSFAPQPNDFGDLECFIYLQDDNKLVTREKRWIAIAGRVCPAHYLQEWII